jgi:hypothetical protein
VGAHFKRISSGNSPLRTPKEHLCESFQYLPNWPVFFGPVQAFEIKENYLARRQAGIKHALVNIESG